jgi:mono/diheme cytochrome c family protein
VLLALTGYETALVVVAGSFIVFALVMALVIPRSRPEFPGKRLPIFLTVCGVFFLAQMTAVLVLAEVGEADEPAREETTTGAQPTEPTPTETTGTETTGTETTATQTTATETTGTETTTTEPSTPAQGDPVAGKEVFLGTSGCAGCHTLSDAGSTGTIGPNLDDLKPSHDAVVAQVTNGGGGMPAFRDSLSEQQIQDVAAYVSSATQG